MDGECPVGYGSHRCHYDAEGTPRPEEPPVMRVVVLSGARRHRPLCVDTVKVSAVNTSTRRFREEKARTRGTPIDQCGEPATHRLDGEPYCASHAGLRALRHLTEAGR
jgi:hypothetical protein